jgi:hypothetical protein
VRKRIGYQDYELVCLLKSMDQNSINELDGLNLSNLYFYEEYWKELKNISSYRNGINHSK